MAHFPLLPGRLPARHDGVVTLAAKLSIHDPSRPSNHSRPQPPLRSHCLVERPSCRSTQHAIGLQASWRETRSLSQPSRPSLDDTHHHPSNQKLTTQASCPSISSHASCDALSLHDHLLHYLTTLSYFIAKRNAHLDNHSTLYHCKNGRQHALSKTLCAAGTAARIDAWDGRASSRRRGRSHRPRSKK